MGKLILLKSTPMKSRLLVLLAFLSACSGSVKEKQAKLYTMAQFMDIVQINGGSFSADGTRLLISSKETGIFNAYEIDIATGKQKQLTTSTDNAVFAYSYFPNDDRVLY